MKKLFFLVSFLFGTLSWSHALVINEIMSNPVGDDGGREWVEVYNNSSSTIDLATLTISIKGGAFVPVASISGTTLLDAHGYAIIGSIVAGATKFLQDYPTYSGLLFKSSISLVNTGVTSIEIKVGGVSEDILSSYTAAKEGLTYSRFSSGFVASNPTPGAENQAIVEESAPQATTTPSGITSTQATVVQMSPAIPNIILYLPLEKTVAAGAESAFTVFGLTREGKTIDNLIYGWAYGDGGQGTGSTTMYRYAYPGRYIVQVEGGNGYVAGTGRMNVRVVAPEIAISAIGNGKYGNYIDIENPNNYDLDFSQWRLIIGSIQFPFPKNTLIAGNSTTHIAGLAMGFASTTIASSTIVKIVFPNLEEIARYIPPEETPFTLTFLSATSTVTSASTTLLFSTSTTGVSSTSQKIEVRPIKSVITTKPLARVLGTSTSTRNNGSTSNIATVPQKGNQKDTRLVAFFKYLFSRK